MKIVEILVNHLQNLPGLGPRSARRIALHLLTKSPETLHTLAEGFRIAYETIQFCEICGNIDSDSPCHICRDETRNQSLIAIVEHISDLWALERSKAFNGTYHILGGVLSAIEGVGPEDLRLNKLKERLYALPAEPIPELILATNLTVEGQTTSHYIQKYFAQDKLTISRLAHGLPAGGELDYMDDGTIITALHARGKI